MHTGELMRARALPVTATDPRAARVMHSGVQRCPPNNSECSKRSLKNTFKKRDKIRFYLPEKVYRKVCDYLDHREEMGNERRESLRTISKSTAIMIALKMTTMHCTCQGKR